MPDHSPYLSEQAGKERIAALVRRIASEWPSSREDYDRLPEKVRDMVDARIEEREAA